MVAQQESIVAETTKNMLMIIKGKRSKRSRPSSPSATDEGGSGVSEEWAVAKSTVSEEEEEMARCLILLAKGPNRTIKSSSMKKNQNNNGTTLYECKTCNRSFPSFQALGGHRTSHKKPKINTPVYDQSQKSSMILSLLKDSSSQIKEKQPKLKVEQFNNDISNVSLTLQMGNTSASASVIPKAKVHDCSICGAEFSSGQALGGHMRRHRPIVTSASPALTRNVLSLDLNLPAPEEDNSSKFVFGLNEKMLVFTASSLVDCHY